MKTKKTPLQTLSCRTVWAPRPKALLRHRPPRREGASGNQAQGGRKGPGGRCVCRGGAGTRPHRNRQGGARGVSVRAGGAGVAGERLRGGPSASLTCAVPARPRWRRIQRQIRERLRRRRRAGKRPRAAPARPLASAPRDGRALS